MRDSNKRNKTVLDLIIVLIILIIFVLFSFLISSLMKSASERAVYEQLLDSAICVVPASVECTEISESPAREVDFDYLDEINPVIGSWIYIPGTVIDYPVVQGLDNYVYLERDAYGNESSAGSIFLDCSNSPDYSDFKSILYGHNKRDGSMFACLHDYTNSDFALKHSLLYIYLDSGEILEYEILCTLPANAYDKKIYLPGVLGDDELVSYLLDNSDVVYKDHMGTELLLLSTCIHGDSRRVVVFQRTITE